MLNNIALYVKYPGLVELTENLITNRLGYYRKDIPFIEGKLAPLSYDDLVQFAGIVGYPVSTTNANELRAGLVNYIHSLVIDTETQDEYSYNLYSTMDRDDMAELARMYNLEQFALAGEAGLFAAKLMKVNVNIPVIHQHEKFAHAYYSMPMDMLRKYAYNHGVYNANIYNNREALIHALIEFHKRRAEKGRQHKPKVHHAHMGAHPGFPSVAHMGAAHVGAYPGFPSVAHMGAAHVGAYPGMMPMATYPGVTSVYAPVKARRASPKKGKKGKKASAKKGSPKKASPKKASPKKASKGKKLRFRFKRKSPSEKSFERKKSIKRKSPSKKSYERENSYERKKSIKRKSPSKKSYEREQSYERKKSIKRKSPSKKSYEREQSYERKSPSKKSYERENSYERKSPSKKSYERKSPSKKSPKRYGSSTTHRSVRSYF